MAVSSNDQYIALKYASHVDIVDISTSRIHHHKLPSQKGRSGPNDHLVAFSTDCCSIVASTRTEPEKVKTYHCDCVDPSKFTVIDTSAPFVSLRCTGFSGFFWTYALKIHSYGPFANSDCTRAWSATMVSHPFSATTHAPSSQPSPRKATRHSYPSPLLVLPAVLSATRENKLAPASIVLFSVPTVRTLSSSTTAT